MSINMNLRSIMDADKLNGPNFLDWIKNMRIVLQREKIAYVLVDPLPHSPIVDAFERVQRAYQKHLVDSARVGLFIFTSMSPKLQKQYKAMDVYFIVRHIREFYNEQARTERFNFSNLLFHSKLEEWTSPFSMH